MIIQTKINERLYQADLSKPIEISITLGDVKCFYAPDVVMKAYENGDFVGAVREGAPVNFFNVHFNPHGNGTHTECLGHITAEQESINDTLKEFHFHCFLATVSLSSLENSDQVITLDDLRKSLPINIPTGIVIRTSPNESSKLKAEYSGTNPPYLSVKAMEFLVENGVEHLLIDTPSVDREVDDGILASHHVFWGLDQNEIQYDSTRKNCTITELIYVPNEVKDGFYLLNLQIAPFHLDASPSKPVLYALEAK
jgi:kynurenine formamidase